MTKVIPRVAAAVASGAIVYALTTLGDAPLLIRLLSAFVVAAAATVVAVWAEGRRHAEGTGASTTIGSDLKSGRDTKIEGVHVVGDGQTEVGNRIDANGDIVIADIKADQPKD